MHLIKRKLAGGGFNIVSKRGGYSRLTRGKVEGHGITEAHYDNNEVQHATPMRAINATMNRISLKDKKPRKYISLNY